MAVKIFPYRAGSRSARALADAIGGRVLRRERSQYRRRPQDIIINWGSGEVPHHLWHRVLGNDVGLLNQPDDVVVASNKLRAFDLFREAGNVNIPNYWRNQNDIPDDAFPVVCRTILNGHSGRGIVMANNRRELVAAPLYVQYIRKQNEYRVHVVRGQVIAVQRKAIRNGFENPNHQIRNHDNGYVFVRQGVNAPQQVLEQALRAVEAIGLDFGAVDIIFNNHRRMAYVLEVNTAPGLEGQTIQDYAQAFRRLV